MIAHLPFRRLVAGLTFALVWCTGKDATVVAVAPNVVTVHARDFAFDLPAQIPAGFTTFKFANDGPNLHHLLIARIDSGKTYADAQAALAKPGMPPMWLVPVGGPNATDPQTTSNATVDLAPGEYALFCMVDVPGGVPHVAKGMIKQLTVTAATGATGGVASAPKADIRIRLADYAFQLAKPLDEFAPGQTQMLTAGPHTFEVVTAVGQPHELVLVRLAPGKTIDDFMKWMGVLMSGKDSGPPTGYALGGVAPALSATTQYFSVELAPGNYAFLCFLPDAKDGQPHFAHGMIQPFTVPTP